MQSFHKELWLDIPNRMEFMNITNDVEDAISESGVQEGLCLINAMHIIQSHVGQKSYT